MMGNSREERRRRLEVDHGWFKDFANNDSD